MKGEERSEEEQNTKNKSMHFEGSLPCSRGLHYSGIWRCVTG
jgi:hypothetical protein